MSTATFTQAQGKGLRQFFAEAAHAVRNFSVAMYAARDREFAREANLLAEREVSERKKRADRRSLLALASESQAFSPNLAAELRHLANRG